MSHHDTHHHHHPIATHSIAAHSLKELEIIHECLGKLHLHRKSVHEAVPAQPARHEPGDEPVREVEHAKHEHPKKAAAPASPFDSMFGGEAATPHAHNPHHVQPDGKPWTYEALVNLQKKLIADGLMTAGEGRKVWEAHGLSVHTAPAPEKIPALVHALYEACRKPAGA